MGRRCVRRFAEAAQLLAHALARQLGVEPLLGGSARRSSRREAPGLLVSSAASSASTTPRLTISGADSRRPVWRSTTTIGDHDALGREVAAVAHHERPRSPRCRRGRGACARRRSAPRARAPARRGAARRRPRRRGRGRRGARRRRRGGRAGPACGTRRGPARGSGADVGCSSSTRSSRLPWPDTWTRAVPGCTTSQPRRKRLPMRRETAALVAGDRAGGEHHGVAGPGRERRGARRRSTIERAESGSPWLPETKTTAASAGPPASDPAARSARPPGAAGGRGRGPRRRCRPSAGRGTPTGRPRARRDVGHPLHPGDRGGEARDQHAPAGAIEDVLEGRDHVVLAAGACPAARRWCCRRAGARTPRSPHSARASRSVRSSGGAPRVDLEVAAVRAPPRPASRWRAPGCRARCGRPGWGGPGRGRSRTGWPGARVRRSALTPRSCSRSAGEAQGEAAAVDRGRGRLQREGEGADVVLVPVGEEDARGAARALGEVVEVGHDRVDPGHLGGRKQHPGVQQEEVLLPLEDHCVQPELSESPERNETQGTGGVGTASSESSSPLLPAFSTRQSPQTPLPIVSLPDATPRG